VEYHGNCFCRQRNEENHLPTAMSLLKRHPRVAHCRKHRDSTIVNLDTLPPLMACANSQILSLFRASFSLRMRTCLTVVRHVSHCESGATQDVCVQACWFYASHPILAAHMMCHIPNFTDILVIDLTKPAEFRATSATLARYQPVSIKFSSQHKSAWCQNLQSYGRTH